jgi:hypothetical protein
MKSSWNMFYGLQGSPAFAYTGGHNLECGYADNGTVTG